MSLNATSTTAASANARACLVGFGRFGFLSKGLVYLLIGALAVQTALGAGGDTTDARGALERIAQLPFGRALLLALGCGLAGYALWRLIQCFFDADRKGNGAKGLAVRTGYLVIAAVHVALAVSAFALVAGSGSGGGDSPQALTAQVMAQPWGRWLVGAVGAIVALYGGAQFRRAASKSFRRKLELDRMSEAEARAATIAGRVGYAARGVVFVVSGVFVITAAVQVDPQQARGLDGALAALAAQPWGWAVLGLVALGLVAYGLYLLVEARYRRMVID